MTSTVPRQRVNDVYVVQPSLRTLKDPEKLGQSTKTKIGTSVSKLWRSEGHRRNPQTGVYNEGGPFHVTHSGDFISPGFVTNAVNGTADLSAVYSGPVFGTFVPSSSLVGHYQGTTEDMDESSMNADGATAISQVAPTNPPASLSTTLAETFREGIPSLPGIQTWRKRTEILKGLGSEYLNYQFGWAPLASEVTNVVNATRKHRDIIKNYRHNEGKNVHRRFDFSPEIQEWSEEVPPASPVSGVISTNFLFTGGALAERVVRVTNERKRWFEGCFTYGGTSNLDSFRRSMGFGSDADAVYGLSLSPDVLWELTPWSWAVDWFTNAGDVIKNVSNFAAAGLVMRYGYMMEETISTYSTEWSDGTFKGIANGSNPRKLIAFRAGAGSRGFKTITKSRAAANPFGFGVGWEGLSPTQLAITAAIGITRLL